MSETKLSSIPAEPVPISIADALANVGRDSLCLPHLCWVEGEIGDVKRANSGHTYFSLSDFPSRIECVLFKSVARHLATPVRDGLLVTVLGRVQQSPKRANLELDVQDVRVRSSQGPRQAARESLRERLSAEGLLDADRKRGLPQHPACVGIVTSAAGDVLQDIMRILRRRHPGVATQFVSVPVTGEAAAKEIAAAIRALSLAGTASPLILARGGGSAADLAAFDTEIVARAIADCRVPVISAVGHEPTTTIADLVADVRCATPSEAAELAVPVQPVTTVPAQDGSAEVCLQLGPASVIVRVPVSDQALPT